MAPNKQSKKTVFKLVGIFLAGVLVLLAASSRNYIELHERLIIQGLGIDRTEQGYKVSVQALKTTEEDKIELLVTEGDTVYDALNNLSLQIGKVPLYTHNIMVVIGRSAAEHGLDDVLDFFVRYHEARPTESVFMASDTAGELFAHQEDGQYTLLKDIDESAHARQYNSQLVQVEVMDVINDLYRRSNSAHLPILSLEDGRIEELGTGIFEQGKLKETLSLEQTRGLMATINKLEVGTEVVQLSDHISVTMEYFDCKSHIETEIKDGKPVFTVKVKCKANISQMDNPIEDQMDDSVYPELEKAVSAKLREQIESAIRWAVIDNQCDVFGFGNALLWQQTDYWREHEDHWRDDMGEADYFVYVDTTIALEGQELSPKPFSVW